MPDTSTALSDRLRARLGDKLQTLRAEHGEVTIEVGSDNWLEVARLLRDDAELRFDTCVDLCGVDYLGFGQDEWDTDDVSDEGFSRGIEGAGPGRFTWEERPRPASDPRRFAVVIHLLSVELNQRLRVRTFCADDSLPVVASLTEIWPGLNWFEREAFDLFGIVFEGHPDLRRILTDYGFVGHPFRKDFPLIGNVEVRFDAEKGRVVYEPVTSVEPRVLVPRVVREDSRYQQSRAEQGS
ncbi:NADH-quinone oxidoreductase subunit C [Pseudomarimonas salicorniae]|uniref:NADH-quinone oxidoreductase subunit C n=1 Tax=Pseudomarimonas salicorniae TaxID=2933270 RepID=A0ABT0GKY3_9GAMM|nr:NADH-quinone oxidoreductase subunit C [Lysobacter sp. CAU 1642]MCK7594690.1 NADH-quinone oxidoreductase subunit C [Lysobacter sp. CAU 1642]